MYCPSCNFENPDGSVFCQHCGARLTPEEQKPEEEKAAAPAAEKAPDAVKAAQEKLDGALEKLPVKVSKKAILGGVAAVCVVILLVVIIAFAAGGGTGFITCDDYISYKYLSEDNETVASFNGKPLSTRIEGAVSASVVSHDGSAALMTVSDGSAYTVYAVTKSGVSTLSEDVVLCGFSADGSHAYCLTNEGELSLYTTKNGSKTKIADDVVTTRGSVAISPKGNVLLYCTPDEEGESDGEFVLNAWKGGKTKEIAKNYVGLAATDDGKYVYIINEENSVYVTKLNGDDRNKICSDVTTVLLNSTGTEIVMFSEDKVYISVKGGEKAKLGNASQLVPAAPESSSAAYGVGITTYFPVETFVGSPVYYAKSSDYDLSLGILTKKGNDYDIVKVSGGITDAATADGKTYYFLKNGDLCRVTAKENAEVEELAEDISSFTLTASGKSVYAIDEDDALVKFTGKNKVKVADDIESSSNYAVIGEGVLYLADVSSSSGEGTLFYSSNGKSKKNITDEAASVSSEATFKLGWYTNSDGDVFYTLNGSSFSQYK